MWSFGRGGGSGPSWPGPGRWVLGVPADPRVTAVEEFLAAVARSVGRDDPASVGWLAGEPGRRLALLLDRLTRMHLPDVAGLCPDCRPHPDGRACTTWAVLAETLAGSEPTRVDRDFRLLLRRRYGSPIDDRRARPVTEGTGR